MFTGIVKQQGVVAAIEQEGSNLHLTISADLHKEIAIDQSIAHDGVCLTVVAIGEGNYTVTAIDETLKKTTLSQWKVGKVVNLELAMLLGTRLDGHVVQGHVDTRGKCTSIEAQNGSHLLRFQFPESYAALMIEKGSICVNGVSLTAFNVGRDSFQVALIPYTFEHTGFQLMNEGDDVNLEFDILGKYFLRKAILDAEA